MLRDLFRRREPEAARVSVEPFGWEFDVAPGQTILQAALAQGLTDLGLIDEYRMYLHPFVIGSGKRYFVGPRPPLRLMASDRIGENVIRLSYAPA